MRACGVIMVLGGLGGLLCGCTTTGRDPAFAEKPTTMPGIYQSQSTTPATADMNWVQKTGYYLGWLSLYSLYAIAASNPEIH